MNSIQELIKEIKVQMKQADDKCNELMKTKNIADYWLQFGFWLACFKHIQMLELLLNAETQTTVKKPEA